MEDPSTSPACTESGDGRDLPVAVAAAAIRRVTAAILTGRGLGDDEADVSVRLEALADRLGALTVSEPASTRRTAGPVRDSPVTGPKNAVALPVCLSVDDVGVVGSVANFGAAYQGPPGFLHGGMAALVLDVALAVAYRQAAAPGLTAELVLQYRRPTPLHTDVTIRAQHTSVSGRTGWARGEILLDDEVCVSAEGRFVTPAPRVTS